MFERIVDTVFCFLFFFRRMFPALRVRITGLEPDARYFVVLEMRLAAPSRFKFSGGRWVSAGAADIQSSSRVLIHSDSPAPGAAWAAREVSFQRAKLTNNTLDHAGNVSASYLLYPTRERLLMQNIVRGSILFWSIVHT